MIDRIIRGELLIRPWRVDDAQALSMAVTQNLDHLRPWLPWIAAEPLPIAARRALIAEWEAGWRRSGDLICGMFVGEAVVGSVGLHRRIGPGAMELGYWVHAAHIRNGYASTGAAALTSLAFTVPGIERVEIHHDPENTASEGVPRKLGYSVIGEQVKPAQAPRETGIQRVWEMRCEDWPAAPGFDGGA